MRDDPNYLRVYGRTTIGGAKRRHPNATTKARILSRQGNFCLYCGLAIGTEIRRRGKVITLRINWDHFVPYSYAARNSNDNWVIACHVCNGIKHSHLFTTVVEAQEYIRPRWRQLGYEVVTAIDHEVSS